MFVIIIINKEVEFLLTKTANKRNIGSTLGGYF